MEWRRKRQRRENNRGWVFQEAKKEQRRRQNHSRIHLALVMSTLLRGLDCSLVYHKNINKFHGYIQKKVDVELRLVFKKMNLLLAVDQNSAEKFFSSKRRTDLLQFVYVCRSALRNISRSFFFFLFLLIGVNVVRSQHCSSVFTPLFLSFYLSFLDVNRKIAPYNTTQTANYHQPSCPLLISIDVLGSSRYASLSETLAISASLFFRFCLSPTAGRTIPIRFKPPNICNISQANGCDRCLRPPLQID